METTSLAPDTLVGTVLGERYELIERAGRGGTAVVYRGLDQRLGRTVAVKIIHDTLAGDADYTRRFDREARAAAALSHPNIVAIFDRGLAGERPYIVMEYIRGQSLRQVIAQQAPLPPLVALSYVDAIARALAAAHDAGLMHRDIKPENVLITTSGQVKVTDFGLAKASQAQDSATHSVLMGTISYLAPEIMTSGQAGLTSDIYAAGIVLYELLTGQKPHTGEEAAAILYKHVNVDVPPPSAALSGSSRTAIPDYLDALVTACTSRNPALRPQNGRVLEQEVARVRQRLVQGFPSDPALAAALRTRGRSGGADATTILVPEADDDTTAAIPHDLIRPDDYTYENSVAPGPDRPVRDRPGAVQPLQPAKPLLQVRKERTYVRRRRGLVVLTLLLIIGLFTGGGVVWWYQAGRWTVQPAVVGLTLAQAETALTLEDFPYELLMEYSETVPNGIVMASLPGDGERIIKQSTVTLTVSRGPERYGLPEVRGLSLTEAKGVLEAESFTVEIQEEYSDDYAAGIVIWMSEEPGASFPPGTTIYLGVSKGPEPVTIPDYTGQSADEAKAALEALQFVVTLTEEHHAEVPEGQVISQTPNSGTGRHGQEIAIVKSLGPVMVEVPNVVGDRRADAESTLRSLGLVPVINEISGYSVFNLVFSMDPKPGTVVPEGTTVTLNLV